MTTVFVFSHNDEGTIEPFLRELDTCLERYEGELPLVVVLANGCVDDTVDVASRTLEAFTSGATGWVEAIEAGGKANAWNHAVHHLLREAPGEDIAVFMDSDIGLEETRLHELVRWLEEHPAASAATSEPRKRREPFSPGNLIQFTLSRSNAPHVDGVICGQLYAARVDRVRRVRMPRGLLVEDGFLAACLRTDMFSIEPDDGLIHAHKDVYHYFEVERSLGGAIRHEARTELGSHMNFIAFPQLWAVKDQEGAEHFLEKRYTEDPDWLVQDFMQELHENGRNVFRWSRAYASFSSVRGGAALPLSLVVAILRTVQRHLALRRAYKLASSGTFRW